MTQKAWQTVQRGFGVWVSHRSGVLEHFGIVWTEKLKEGRYDKDDRAEEVCSSCSVYLPGGLRVNLSSLFSTCSNKSLLADMHGDSKLLFLVPISAQ